MQKGISKICIENVKGFSSWSLEEFLLPNRPHIFVAPNGFGKSSFATAFESLNTKKIALAEKHFHRCNLANKPKVEITYSVDDKCFTYTATEHNNSILSEFDVYVINSPLIAKAVKQNFGKYTVASASMEIEPVVLKNTIPARKKIDYKISDIKSSTTKKLRFYYKNIKPDLDNTELMCAIEKKVDWSKLELKQVQNLIEELLEFLEKSQEYVSEFPDDIIEKIHNNERLYKILQDVQEIIKGNYLLQSLFFLLQVKYLRDKDRKCFNDTMKWYEYCIEKQHYTYLLKSLNSSWSSIVPKEHKGKLIVEFPDAEYLSNGQRDFLSFVIRLYLSRKYLKKDKCILIIDEIFDYLDDANLVAFQYYIAMFVKLFKDNGQELYPILMTHLDPLLFSHFRLKKITIHHLDNRRFSDNLHLKKLIIKRSDESIKYFVNRYLFHFYPDHCSKITEFNKLGLRKDLADTKTFHPLMLEEVKKYLRGEEADPFAICIALRVKIEERLYKHLPSEELKQMLIETHTTQEKLEFSAKHLKHISEIFYLLGIIYNSSLHGNAENIDILGKCLLRNLTNITIKSMIATVFKDLRKD